ncbi:hypothetical protein OG568_60665 (plasmid) [Streptomyces sp. NBC_01450]|uniref:hypothetical protein n=1 Tax=Streptomyces sp. NBC_01450 TaxID=2903871 RepID=UPI002E33B547|nr:hypothetical protein [Streptomyces sp. NBC_01450]
MLSRNDQLKIIDAVSISLARDDLIVGGDFALNAHELRDNTESDQVCFFVTGEIKTGLFGSEHLQRARERVKNMGYSDDHLRVLQAPRLQYPPTPYLHGPANTQILSVEDAIRIKIDCCSDRSGRQFPGGDFHDLYQIKEKLGIFGLDGFIASRIDHVKTDDLRANLRRTWSDLRWNDEIKAYASNLSGARSPEEVLAGLKALENEELPMTMATLQLFRAIESKNETRIFNCQKNLTGAIRKAIRDGFQPSLLPASPNEITYTDRPVNPASQAADVAKNEIEKYSSADTLNSPHAEPGIYGLSPVPHYTSGAILGPLAYSARLSRGIASSNPSECSAWLNRDKIPAVTGSPVGSSSSPARRR